MNSNPVPEVGKKGRANGGRGELITTVQSVEKIDLKYEGTQGKKRLEAVSATTKTPECGCSFDEMSKRATSETTVMRRILSFPLRGPRGGSS